MEDEAEHYGPLMQALTEHQRAFVIQLLTNPHKPATDWARAAGFTDGPGIKVRAHHLRHNPKILAAAREEAGRHLNREGVAMAVAVLVHELSSPDAKTRLAAANSILDRGGVTAKTEHTVRVEHNVEQMEAIAQRLAVELGIEPMKLIGGNTVSKAGGDAGHTPTMRAGRHDDAPAFDAVDGTQPEMEVGHSAATPASDARETVPPHGLSPEDIEKAKRGPTRPGEVNSLPEPGAGAAERVRQQMDIDSDIAF